MNDLFEDLGKLILGIRRFDVLEWDYRSSASGWRGRWLLHLFEYDFATSFHTYSYPQMGIEQVNEEVRNPTPPIPSKGKAEKMAKIREGLGSRLFHVGSFKELELEGKSPLPEAPSFLVIFFPGCTPGGVEQSRTDGC